MTSFITSHDKLTELVTDPKLDIKSLFATNPSTLQVTYQQKEEHATSNRNTQMALNGCLTAMARILLDSHIRQVLKSGGIPKYGDTDSLMYLIRRDKADHLPRHPVKLGFFKSEVEPGLYIRRFVSLSPKNYSLDFASEETHEIVRYVVKCKGLALKGVTAAQHVNSDVMYDMIQSLASGQNVTKRVPQFKISINRKTKTLKAEEVFKKYTNQGEHMKRFFRPDKGFLTWPFGLTSWTPDNGCTS